MRQVDDRLTKYLDACVRETKHRNLKVEKDWLHSIHAPVKQLPKRIA